MAIFQSVEIPEQQLPQNQNPSPSRAKKVLRYAMMPEILPRIRALGVHFGHFAYLLALVFGSARLIPQAHPVLNPANIGRCGDRQVIAIAANNLVWDRKHVDQIGIFSAIILGLVMIFIQLGLIAVMVVFGGEAQASPNPSSFFKVEDPSNDPIMIMFSQVFGVLSGGGSNFWGAAGPGSNSAIHQGLYKMLSLYSMAMMVIAVIIVLYYILTVISEAAKTGTPFGSRFNSLWAPIRLIVALGLLVPLGSGLNSAQYITLWMAKMGSGLGTQAWKLMSSEIDKDPARYNVAEFSTPWVRELAMEVFFMEVCKAAYNKESTLSGSDYVMKADPIQDETDNDGKYSYKIAYQNDAWAINLVHKAYCGNVHIEMEEQDNSLIAKSQSVPVKEVFAASKDIVVTMTNGSNVISQEAEKYVDGQISIGGAGNTVKLSESYDKIMSYADALDQGVRSSLSAKINTEQDAAFAKLLDSRDKSWVYAGVWYLELSRLIQATKDSAISSRPNTTAVSVSNLDGSPIVGILTHNASRGNVKFEGIYGIDVEATASLFDAWSYYQSNKYKYVKGSPPVCDSITRGSNAVEAAACFILSLIVPEDLVVLASGSTKTLDPMASLLSAGYSILQRAWTSILIGGALSGVAGIAGIFGGAAGVIGSIAGILGNIVIFIGVLGLGVGIVLYFLLPVFPFIYFFFAIASWVMEIFEAIVAMPLWALAHLSIDGDGMPGQAAMSGYYLLLAILLRPVLIVLGLVASSLVFGAIIYLLQTLWASVLFIKGGGSTTGVEVLGYAILFASLCYSAGVTSFKLVDTIPNGILRWMGNNPGTFSDAKEDGIGNSTSMAMAAGGVMGSQLAGHIGQGASSFGKGVGSFGKGIKDRMRASSTTTTPLPDKSPSTDLGSHGEHSGSSGDTSYTYGSGLGPKKPGGDDKA